MSDFDDEDSQRRPGKELRHIARCQRWVVAVILAELVLWGGYLLLSLNSRRSFYNGAGFPVFLTVILGCVGSVFLFQIYKANRDPVTGTILTLTTLIPGIGFFALVVANSSATRTLRENGVKVGFFGANLDSIKDDSDPGESLYDADDAGW